jgi:hypothetical protein
MQELPEDFSVLPIADSAHRSIQSGVELAMVQNSPITSAHLLFGIYMSDQTAAASLLRERGITPEEILDAIPSYLPDEEPPF